MKNPLPYYGIGVVFIIVILLFSIVTILFSKEHENSIPVLKNAKYITSKNNNLEVYEYIHELTHSFVKTNRKDVKVIAPTKYARNLGVTLCENEIYMKGDIDTYSDIGYLIDKINYGLIDEDIIKLHNIVSEKSGEKNCISKSLNIELINQIVDNNKFFDDTDKQNYNNLKH
ncbi:hypothetical protein KD33_13680 [Clostridium sp. NCR]|nr:hypothetical protein KD33_13680 [Clostridium sp. NCR]